MIAGDHGPRQPWTRQVDVAGVNQTGPGRQWVATRDGFAAAVKEPYA